MIDAVLDTTVILHLYRKYRPAMGWFNNQQRYGITSITWLEVMEGASSKANQAYCKELLSQFEMLYLTSVDQQWAMAQLERFQFSHHIGKDDCLIASVAHRLGLPLYTHNLKDDEACCTDAVTIVLAGDVNSSHSSSDCFTT